MGKDPQFESVCLPRPNPVTSRGKSTFHKPDIRFDLAEEYGHARF